MYTLRYTSAIGLSFVVLVDVSFVVLDLFISLSLC